MVCHLIFATVFYQFKNTFPNYLLYLKHFKIAFKHTAYYIVHSYENQIICTPGTVQQKLHYQSTF